jgi:sulfur carrier protein
MRIELNGEAYEIAAPLTVTELLARLEIDARRVAVEHNLVVLKRSAFDATVVQDGDQVEIVNFVGGGQGKQQVRSQKYEVRSTKSEVRSKRYEV